jgi:hypothetical protein
MSVQHSPSPVLRSQSEAGWERVPDRAGEGSLTQTQALERVETKGPPPAIACALAAQACNRGHLLPPAAGEGELGKWGIIQ